MRSDEEHKKAERQNDMMLARGLGRANAPRP